MAEDYKLIDNEEKHRYEFQIEQWRNLPCSY